MNKSSIPQFKNLGHPDFSSGDMLVLQDKHAPAKSTAIIDSSATDAAYSYVNYSKDDDRRSMYPSSGRCPR